MGGNELHAFFTPVLVVSDVCFSHWVKVVIFVNRCSTSLAFKIIIIMSDKHFGINRQHCIQITDYSKTHPFVWYIEDGLEDKFIQQISTVLRFALHSHIQSAYTTLCEFPEKLLHSTNILTK